MSRSPTEPPPPPPSRPGDDEPPRDEELDALRKQNMALKAQVDELKALASEGDQEPARSLQHLHLLQIQPVRDLLVILLIVGVIYLGYVLRPLTIPLLLALALAYLFEPVVRRMTEAGRIRRSLAAITIIFAMVLVVTLPVASGIAYGTVQGVHYGRQLADNIRILEASVAAPRDQELKKEVQQLGRPWVWIRAAMLGADREIKESTEEETEPADDRDAGEPANDETPVADEELIRQVDVDEEAARSAGEGGLQMGQPARTGAVDARLMARQALAWVNEWVQRSAASLGAAFGRQAIGTGGDVLRVVWRVISRSMYLVFAAFLVLFFFFFFSVNYQRVLNSLADLIPKWKRARTIEMIRKMDGVVSGFVRGRLIIMCIQTVMFIIGYWAVGVPAALVVGLVVGVLSLVPYLSLIGIPLTIALMLLQPNPPVWWWVIFAPTVVYFIVQLSDDYVWTPMIQGKATDMDIPSILFAVLAGGILAGFYGVLLAIPAAACIKILLKEAFWPRFKAWSDGRVKDFLPISRYDPTATEGEKR